MLSNYNIQHYNIQHYNIQIKGKVEQFREWSSALPYTTV